MQRDLTIDPEVVQAFAVAAELTGTVLSEAATFQLAKDMAKYPPALVLGAVERFRMEAKAGTRMTPAELILRLPDGRPSPDEAWAMIPRSEDDSAAWTEEMRIAWAVARPLIDMKGEAFAARNAFVESYRSEVMRARVSGKTVRWSMSFGTDPRKRESAVLMAVEAGRITEQRAQALLPTMDLKPSGPPALEDKRRVAEHISKITALLTAGKRRGDDERTEGPGGVQDGGRQERDGSDGSDHEGASGGDVRHR